MEYALTRARRKSVGIRISPEGSVLVRAPYGVPVAEVDRIVASHREWIETKQAQLAHRQTKRAAFTLGYGDKILYRGSEYPLAAQPGTRAGFDGKAFYVPENLSAGQIKDTIVGMYKLLARQWLDRRVPDFSKAMGLSPPDIKITSAKTRWGSCNAKGGLNFSWRLILARDEVIDYVIVHELAHRREFNHSPRFWAIVEKQLPHYREMQSELKDLQKRLATENWD